MFERGEPYALVAVIVSVLFLLIDRGTGKTQWSTSIGVITGNSSARQMMIFLSLYVFDSKTQNRSQKRIHGSFLSHVKLFSQKNIA